MRRPSNRRLLLVDLGEVTGGVEVYLRRLAQILSPSIELYCICLSKQTAADLREEGVRVTLLPRLGRGTRVLGFLAAAFVIPYLVLAHQIDSVQVNGFLEAVFLLQARLLGRKAIYTRHGPFEDDLYHWFRQPRWYLPRFVARCCARAASVLICVSTGTQETLDPRLLPKSTVIPHWVTPAETHVPPASSLKTPVRVLCVSRLEEYKGIQFVMDAIRSLPEVELWIVGDGGYRAALERRAAGLNVRFFGFQTDPSPYLRAADIFVMPSLGPEGSSIAALEAMAHGLPCILSDLVVNVELSGSGQATLHFRRGDAADLKEKLELVLRDPLCRIHYANAAYERVQRVFSPDRAERAYCEILGYRHTGREAMA